MMDYETFCKIKAMHDHEGLNCAQIAAEIEVDPRTVRKWMAEERYRQRKTAIKTSILD